VQSDGPYKLVRVANGAHSIYSKAYDETFHPVIGPVAEAEALYVRQLRLHERFTQNKGPWVVWDVGLGAAANALTVLRVTQEAHCSIHLLSFDQTLEPLRFALEHAAELGYFGGYEEAVAALASGSTQSLTFQHGHQEVRWEFHLGDFPTLINALEAKNFPKPHAILFDAFSPATNPAMWTQPLFARIFSLLDPKRPCALPTYSRSTMLRVTLLLAGFFVGRGHATGEKEETTIAANARDLVTDPLDQQWLKRARNSSSAEPLWTPVYRQAPLSPDTWLELQQHPQFSSVSPK
jgi:tRNA U34 5-methylaminomethyl-2-thiouridine-forming methyltransferase MnmC